MLEVDDKTHPSTQICGRNRRKTPQIAKSKIGPKIPPKISKNEKHSSSTREMIQPKRTAILMQIKGLQGVEITQTSSHSLEDVALVDKLRYNLMSVSQLIDDNLDVLFHKSNSKVLDSRGDLVCDISRIKKVFKLIFLLLNPL
jgi:hypothetical protein